MQEDIIDNTYRVVCYRHEAACDDCGKWVLKAGKDEILGSFFGPYFRSRAVWLRNIITTRRVQAKSLAISWATILQAHW